MPYIYIVPIGQGEPPWAKSLENMISRSFRFDVKLKNSDISLPDTFDISRNQYNSSLILLRLIANPPPDAIKILGVVGVDLFIPILTFVFGEAQLNGIGSVVSSHRLDDRFYGLPENKELMTQRLIKEAVHELGHTFGLIHCRDAPCVMNASTYVENIDQKPVDLCPSCQKNLKAEKFYQRFSSFRWKK